MQISLAKRGFASAPLGAEKKNLPFVRQPVKDKALERLLGIDSLLARSATGFSFSSHWISLSFKVGETGRGMAADGISRRRPRQTASFFKAKRLPSFCFFCKKVSNPTAVSSEEKIL